MGEDIWECKLELSLHPASPKTEHHFLVYMEFGKQGSHVETWSWYESSEVEYEDEWVEYEDMWVEYEDTWVEHKDLWVEYEELRASVKEAHYLSLSSCCEHPLH